MPRASKTDWELVKQIASAIKGAMGEARALEEVKKRYGEYSERDGVVFLTAEKTTQGSQSSLTTGIKGLNQTFVLVGDELFELGPTLGQGSFGRVISAYTKEGTHLAIKIETERNYNPAETDALKVVGQLHDMGARKIGDVFYTFMYAVPGRDLNKLMTKIRHPEPWKVAANKLSLKTEVDAITERLPLTDLLDSKKRPAILKLKIIDEAQLDSLIEEYHTVTQSFTDVWYEAAKQLDAQEGSPEKRYQRQLMQARAQELDLNTEAGRADALDEDFPIFQKKELHTLIQKKDELLEHFALCEEERYQLAIAAANDLDHVFQQGLLHRDIKGANFVGAIKPLTSLSSKTQKSRHPELMQPKKTKAYADFDEGEPMAPQRNDTIVRLVDFGGALPIKECAKAKFYMGTPGYAAPEIQTSIGRREQRHLRAADRRADAYDQTDAQFSTASEVYSFAQTCLKDFGLTPEAGFGILAQCLEEDPRRRPDIKAVKTALGAELIFKHPLRGEPISSEEATLIAPHIQDQLGVFKQDFMQAYDKVKTHEKSRFSFTKPKPSFGITPDMSMAEIVTHAQTKGKRSRELLQVLHLMRGKEATPRLQQLLDLEQSVSDILQTDECDHILKGSI